MSKDLKGVEDLRRLLKRQYFEIQQLHRVINEIEKVHQGVSDPLDDNDVYCENCLEDWPCATIRLIREWRYNASNMDEA